MSAFPAVALPQGHAGTDRRDELRESIDAWVRSEALTALVSTFGGTIPSTSLDDTLNWFDAFTEEHWNFRKGLERNEFVPGKFTPDVDEQILDAATALRLRGEPTPRYTEYDHVLILGGLVGACISRPEHARKLIDRGLSVGRVTALGGFRPLNDNEAPLVAAFELDGLDNEVDVMQVGTQRAFGLAEPTQVREHREGKEDERSWRVVDFASAPPVNVVAAPGTRPGKRANTPDTYRYWAENVVGLADRPGTRVLLITSAIYVPFQGTDAIRILGLEYQALVDTVGVDTTLSSHPSIRKPFTTSHYLQEMRAALRSMQTLLGELDEKVDS